MEKLKPYDSGHEDYHRQIASIIKTLKMDLSDRKGALSRIQSSLDKLAIKYQDDESLGSERYALYQAQALLHYQRGEDEDAVDFMRMAIEANGNPYQEATDFLHKFDINTLKQPIESEHSDTSEDKNTIKKKESFGAQIGGILISLAFLALGRVLGLSLYILFIPFILGYYLGTKFSRKLSVKSLKFVAWTNIITWFIPVIGVLTAVFSYTTFSDKRLKDWKSNLETLITFGFILSISNGVIGVMNKMNNTTNTDSLYVLLTHTFWLALAIFLVWLSLRIHASDKSRSTYKRIVIWCLSIIFVISGLSLGAGITVDFYTKYVSGNNYDNSNISPIVYWSSFKTICSNEAVKGEGVSKQSADIYCGCISNKLSLKFTPAEAESQSKDENSSYNLFIKNEKLSCGDQAGLVFK